MANAMPAALFWRAHDRLDYWIMQARLRFVDAIYGPEPQTDAERQHCNAKWV
jgi:hypothetical protein